MKQIFITLLELVILISSFVFTLLVSAEQLQTMTYLLCSLSLFITINIAIAIIYLLLQK